MRVVLFGAKSYEVDDQGFLLDHTRWDENFAECVARLNGIANGLDRRQWEIVRFLRRRFQETGRCPLVFETCRANRVGLREMKRLFPSGYLRGACKVAGITYADRAKNFYGEESSAAAQGGPRAAEKSYRVTALGFLANPAEWDEDFAIFKAQELGMSPLTDDHWQVIRYLRAQYTSTGTFPTIYDTAEALGLDLDQFQRLFPTGYHRGAVKLAGLRAL